MSETPSLPGFRSSSHRLSVSHERLEGKIRYALDVLARDVGSLSKVSTSRLERAVSTFLVECRAAESQGGSSNRPSSAGDGTGARSKWGVTKASSPEETQERIRRRKGDYTRRK